MQGLFSLSILPVNREYLVQDQSRQSAPDSRHSGFKLSYIDPESKTYLRVLSAKNDGA
jgi:hypothetical protein